MRYYNVLFTIYYCISSTAIIPLIYFSLNPYWYNAWFLLFLFPLQVKDYLFRSYCGDVCFKGNKYLCRGSRVYFVSLLVSSYLAICTSYVMVYVSVLSIVFIFRLYHFNAVLYLLGYRSYVIFDSSNSVFVISKSARLTTKSSYINRRLHIV